MRENEVRGPAVPGFRAADALIRSLVGVADVHIETSPDGGIIRIAVTPDGSANDRQLVRNVHSALKAYFGLDLDLSAITITPARADTSVHTSQGAPTPASAQVVVVSPTANGKHAESRANGAGRLAALGNAAAVNGAATARNDHAAMGNGVKRNGTGEVSPHLNGAVIAHAPAQVHACASADLDARLGSVEFQHVGSTRRCRVIISYADTCFTGIAEALQPGISDLELVSRASLEALRSTCRSLEPLRFEGVAVTDVAGRAHVIVSIAHGNGPDSELIAGAEPIRTTAAEAAARATIGSVRARLHV